MFVRAANPIWFMVDHVGEPLNDEYYAFFLTNTLPYLPQNVYRDPQGMTVWTGDIVQFSPAGTLPDNLYFDPALVYRIEIRHGNSQTDALIWEINNFVPGEGSSTNNELSILANDNQITNPQFTFINFISPLTITASGTYNIAPGWDLILTGSGTTTLSQNILSGSQNIVNSPPFSLRVNNNGWTTATLRQRFAENGSIWANGAITMQLTGRAQTSPQAITMVYSPSTPGTSQVVASGTLTTGDYQILKGAVDVLASTNTTFNDTAYTDMLITLPPTGIVDLSNVQVIGQGDPLPSDFDPATDIPLYQQQSNERETDHLFHIYANSLIRESKNSFLVGWNFGLNPWQFRTTSNTNVAANQYTADQTIVIQQAYVASATGNNVSVGRATFNGDNYAFQVVPQTVHNQFGIVQYIDPATVRPYWGEVVSALVDMFTNTQHNTTFKVKMRLFYKAGLPGTVSQTDPIASWTELGDPVFAAGYTAIIPPNDPVLVIQPGAGGQFSFNGITLPGSSNANMTLGIMVYTVANMDSTGTADILFFRDISLVRNDFAIATQSQTFDEVLRQCQYYFEKSYEIDTLAGAATSVGARFAEQLADGSNPINLIARGFGFAFSTIKRAAPTVRLYSLIGSADTVSGIIANNGGGNPPADGTVTALWTESWLDSKSVAYIANTISPLTAVLAVAALPEGFLSFHYTADARLGL